MSLVSRGLTAVINCSVTYVTQQLRSYHENLSAVFVKPQQ